jgi:hypothetical protein
MLKIIFLKKYYFNIFIKKYILKNNYNKIFKQKKKMQASQLP